MSRAKSTADWAVAAELWAWTETHAAAVAAMVAAAKPGRYPIRILQRGTLPRDPEGNTDFVRRGVREAGRERDVAIRDPKQLRSAIRVESGSRIPDHGSRYVYSLKRDDRVDLVARAQAKLAMKAAPRKSATLKRQRIERPHQSSVRAVAWPRPRPADDDSDAASTTPCPTTSRRI